MIYLNNAATSFPKPPCVLDAVKAAIEQPPYHHARAGFEREDANLLMQCRKLLCRLFNAEHPAGMVFTSGATASLNLAISGLQLQGMHVVTTAAEHNSVLRPLKTLERDQNVALTIVDCNEFGQVCPYNVEKAMRDDTAAVIVNHCSNVTGIANDLHAIGEVAKKHDATFVVDASQSAGVVPIDVQAMNIDVLAFTGHKSLYGIQGIGGLYVRADVHLKPLIVGGTGVRSDYLFQPESMPMWLEAGTQNMPGIASLCEGVAFVLKEGVEKLRRHKAQIVENMRKHLARIDGLRLYPRDGWVQETTMFCFSLPGISADDFGYMLEHSFGITVRSGLHCAPLIHQSLGAPPDGTVRISPSHFTTYEDAEAFNRAMDEICSLA